MTGQRTRLRSIQVFIRCHGLALGRSPSDNPRRVTPLSTLVKDTPFAIEITKSDASDPVRDIVLQLQGVSGVFTRGWRVDFCATTMSVKNAVELANQLNAEAVFCSPVDLGRNQTISLLNASLQQGDRGPNQRLPAW
eukprot:TRINITY_DN39491_c0_g1_i1.p2 TRINITY_DN39491_c0_g1~~TRINITY_DN39491_c0_g1_i1.p2  ORF type:complete len:137 (-),score=6.54 TRINITY_DN39491_c0_g1_i1:144-554(-)